MFETLILFTIVTLEMIKYSFFYSMKLNFLQCVAFIFCTCDTSFPIQISLLLPLTQATSNVQDPNNLMSFRMSLVTPLTAEGSISVDATFPFFVLSFHDANGQAKSVRSKNQAEMNRVKVQAKLTQKVSQTNLG